MASQIKIVAGNTAPSWQINCERAGVPINLTGCTVEVIIARGNVVTNAAGACTILNAATGLINYVPLATDCPTAGTYKVDVKITYADFSHEVLYEQLKVKTRKPIIVQ